MPLLVTVALDLTEAATLRELKQFVEQAERIGADLDTDLRKRDDNHDLIELEAVGHLDEPAG